MARRYNASSSSVCRRSGIRQRLSSIWSFAICCALFLLQPHATVASEVYEKQANPSITRQEVPITRSPSNLRLRQTSHQDPVNSKIHDDRMSRDENWKINKGHDLLSSQGRRLELSNDIGKHHNHPQVESTVAEESNPFWSWLRRSLQQTATLQTTTTTHLQEYRDPVLQTRFGHLDVAYFTGVWDVCRAQSSGVVDGYHLQQAWKKPNAFEEICHTFKEWAGNAFGPFSARVDPALPEQSYQLSWATSGLYTCNSLHIFSELQAIDAKNQTSNSYFSIVTIPCKITIVCALTASVISHYHDTLPLVQRPCDRRQGIGARLPRGQPITAARLMYWFSHATYTKASREDCSTKVDRCRPSHGDTELHRLLATHPSIGFHQWRFDHGRRNRRNRWECHLRYRRWSLHQDSRLSTLLPGRSTTR